MAKIKSNTPLDIVINGTTVFTADSSGISITGSLNSTTPVTSASYAETASYALNAGGATINTSSFATTGSNQFNGDQTITGSLNIIFTSGSSPRNLISVASQSITRFTLSNFGAASFTLNTSAVEAGSVNISTPSGFPGLQFLTSGSLNRVDMFNSGSLFALGYRLINTYGTLAIFNTSHNVSIGYHASGSGFSSIPIDSGYKLLVSSSGVSGSFNANNVLLVSSSNVNINGNTIITGSLRTTTGLNIAGTATFTGDIVRSNFIAGGNNAFQAIQFLAGLYDTNQQLYALSGSTQLSPPFVVRRSVNTAGSKGIVAGLETNGTSQGGINGSLWAFTAGNGSRQIVRAGLDIINLVNTAASESADLAFYTKPGSPANTAVIERMRITSTGTTIFSGSVTFAAPTSPAFNGEIVRFGAGTLTTGQLYFLSSSGTWSLADASTTGSSTGMLGIAVGSSPTTDGLLIRGFAASSSYTYGTGSVVYMATGSGIMTATSPSSSNHVVRVMGYQTTLSNTIYFDPSKTWVTLA